MRHPKQLAVTIVTRIHLPEPGAAALRIAGVERELVNRGALVRVLTTRAPRAGEPDAAGVRISRWPVLRARDGQLRGIVPYLTFDLPLVWRVLASSAPDVYLVEPPPTTGAVMRVLAALKRRPYVWYAADIWSDAARSAGMGGAMVAAIAWLETFALKGASRVIAISPGVAERAEALGGTRVEVIKNGVDTDVFNLGVSPPSDSALAKAGVRYPYFVYAGTASEWQGAEIFIDALSHVPESAPPFQLAFIGQGSSWDAIVERSRHVPDLPGGVPRVVVLDQQDARTAARWQAGALGALVSIVPGKGYDFAYPTKTLAALACGTPVIYSGVGPVAEDVNQSALGRAVEFDPAPIGAAYAQYASASGYSEDRGRRHDWVRSHRSTAAASRAVANLLETLGRGIGH